ncbi:hypothetical protein [Halobaculum sp. EA56]|uniref:hypothetical protein n=1 Tax=Halobaculum sp. EA56 TaxID=3421648 RepID=UPI003EBD68B3
MPEQVTFDSYSAAIAAGADGPWSPDRRPATPDAAPRPYGVDAPAASESDSDPERFVTFGVVEFAPRE